jgi:hypothetical protein
MAAPALQPKVSILTELPSTLFTAARDSFFSATPNVAAEQTMFVVFLVSVLLGCLIYVIYTAVQKSRAPPIMSPDNVALAQGKREAEIKGYTELVGDKSLNDLIKNLAMGERYLVNLSPLTASLGGYIGAGETGVFYSEFYLQNALRAGIRSFVLPISVYADDNKRPPNWPMSGNPAVVARDTQGKIISLNGLSVKQFCTDLMRYNSQNPAKSSEPIFLFILEDKGYVPDKVKDERKYATLLSKLASELDVIPSSTRLTTIGGYGSAVGSQNEANILTQIPLSELQGKILIFTDFDTSIGLKQTYAPLGATLSTYTNFSLKPVIAENAGLSAGSGARSIGIKDISGSKVNWKDQARTVIHATTHDYNLSIPESTEVEGALNIGIQVIPVPFYTNNSNEPLKAIWDLWKGYAWRLKQPEARYLKPDPVVPAKPSAKMNARVDANLQPGQMGV